jgi:hypothetical protein
VCERKGDCGSELASTYLTTIAVENHSKTKIQKLSDIERDIERHWERKREEERGRERGREVISILLSFPLSLSLSLSLSLFRLSRTFPIYHIF